MPEPERRPGMRPRSHPFSDPGDQSPPKPAPAPTLQAGATAQSASSPAPKTALNARIDPATHRAIRHAALDQHRTVAEIVEEALGDWLVKNQA